MNLENVNKVTELTTKLKILKKNVSKLDAVIKDDYKHLKITDIKSSSNQTGYYALETVTANHSPDNKYEKRLQEHIRSFMLCEIKNIEEELKPL